MAIRSLLSFSNNFSRGYPVWQPLIALQEIQLARFDGQPRKSAEFFMPPIATTRDFSDWCAAHLTDLVVPGASFFTAKTKIRPVSMPRQPISSWMYSVLLDRREGSKSIRAIVPHIITGFSMVAGFFSTRIFPAARQAEPRPAPRAQPVLRLSTKRWCICMLKAPMGNLTLNQPNVMSSSR